MSKKEKLIYLVARIYYAAKWTITYNSLDPFKEFIYTSIWAIDADPNGI